MGHVGNGLLQAIFTFGVETSVLSDVIMDTQCDMCVIMTLFVVLSVLLRHVWKWCVDAGTRTQFMRSESQKYHCLPTPSSLPEQYSIIHAILQHMSLAHVH